MKEVFGYPEAIFGWVMAVNAGLVALLQYAVSGWAERQPRLRMMAVGALLYAVGLGSLGLSRSLPGFLLGVSIVSFGQMIAIPLSNSVAADAAPIDLRGRYMGVMGFTWNAGFGIGPSLGGVVADRIGFRVVWPVMFAVGSLAAGAYLLLERRIARSRPVMAYGAGRIEREER
jgi:MFS family permease